MGYQHFPLPSRPVSPGLEAVEGLRLQQLQELRRVTDGAASEQTSRRYAFTALRDGVGIHLSLRSSTTSAATSVPAVPVVGIFPE